MSACGSWSQAKNILCVRLDSLGDVLMTTPALRALKESGSDRRITLLTSPAGAEAASLVPEIDAVLVYQAPWMKATPPHTGSTPEYAIAERLRRLQFEAAVIFTVYSQNPLPAAFLCYLADIPLRLAHCHENPYQLLTHWVQDPEPSTRIRHEVQRQLDLVAAVGCGTANARLSIRFPHRAHFHALRWLREMEIDRRRSWVVIHPGASAASRRYPAAGFAKVAQRLVRELDCPVVFTGDQMERELIEQIRGLMGVPSHSLAGQLSLAELAALLSVAPLLIANNTGPVHVAAAVGTPVVDLYALTNPQHTPWGVPSRVLFHDVPCKYCYKSVCPEGHHDCLHRVSPDAIVTAACELLRDVAKPQANAGRLEPVEEPAVPA
ncbi:MAG TPA: lipopolysaccharide heptosyltransferase II [Gemmataceae bacterium]|nr:lipopolysaccharide heptosyltransferase II [Gemmataceae bacterium]